MDLREIKERAIQVKDGMEVFWPQLTKSGQINLKKLHPEKNRGKYAYNNSVIAFVDEEDSLYVIPSLAGVRQGLEAAGYVCDYFYVPFSNWDYPVQEQKKWEDLFDELQRGFEE